MCHWMAGTPNPQNPQLPSPMYEPLKFLLHTPELQSRHFFQPNFLFLHENICCGYSLEVPQWGTSNEYPQHMFSWGKKAKQLYVSRAMTLDLKLQQDFNNK